MSAYSVWCVYRNITLNTIDALGHSSSPEKKLHGILFQRQEKVMKVLISNTSDTPLYQQIKDQITDAILRGELKEGDPLPSIRSFANDLRVSVLTIRRVYDDLEKEGYINSQVGIGTFVSTGNTELLREAKLRLVEQKMQDMIQTARSLGISRQELNDMMDILYEEEPGT